MWYVTQQDSILFVSHHARYVPCDTNKILFALCHIMQSMCNVTHKDSICFLSHCARYVRCDTNKILFALCHIIQDMCYVTHRRFNLLCVTSCKVSAM
jgi:hypothetical protein